MTRLEPNADFDRSSSAGVFWLGSSSRLTVTVVVDTTAASRSRMVARPHFGNDTRTNSGEGGRRFKLRPSRRMALPPGFTDGDATDVLLRCPPLSTGPAPIV